MRHLDGDLNELRFSLEHSLTSSLHGEVSIDLLMTVAHANTLCVRRTLDQFQLEVELPQGLF